MGNRIKSSIATLVLGSLIGIGTCLPANAEISAARKVADATEFKANVLVKSGEIKADSLIKNDIDSQLKEELAAIKIGYIPNPLGELIIDRQTLQKKLGILSRNVVMPERVTIKRNGALLKGSDVKARIIELCQGKSSEALDIDVSRVPSTLILPGNAINWDLNTSSDNILGMKLFALTAETDGGPFRQLIQVKVSRSVEAAQFTRLARPGEVISGDLIKPQKITIKSDQANLPLSYSEALGKSLGRFKSAGTVLRNSDIATKPVEPQTEMVHKVASTQARAVERAALLVKPGANVDFQVKTGTLSLKIPAKAVSGGNPGDEITLINLQNKRRIKGVVTEKGTVEYAQN